MDNEFKTELQSVIESLLLPDNLIIKKMNSNQISVKEMKQFILDYLKLFQTNQIPRASSIYELTVESFMHNLINKCLDDYKLTIYRNEDIITEERLSVIHEKCKERALAMYDDTKKMGNSGHAKTFRSKLEDEIEKFFVTFKDQTEKSILKIKEERIKFEKLLTIERQLREQAVYTKGQIERQLIELENARQENLIELNDYKSQKALLETRLNRKCRKLQEFKEKLQREEKFRWIMLGILGLSIVVTGGAVALALESAELAGAAITVGTAVTASSAGLGLTGSNNKSETSLPTAGPNNSEVPQAASQRSFFEKVNACVEASGDAMQLAKNVTNIIEIVSTCVLNIKKQQSGVSQ
ncbi:hypothetical protein ACKWTF_005525 [Chironomus riparius]